MYAVFECDGRQYRVSEGDRVRLEKHEAKVGDKIDLGPVLFIGGDETTHIGAPHLEKAKVTAEVLSQGKAKKIIVFKKRKRTGYRKKQGHRQLFTEVKITKIVGA